MAKTEEKDEKEFKTVQKAAGKSSEEEALRERIGEAKGAQKSAAEEVKKSQTEEAASEAAAPAMLTKVEKFQEFFKERNFFDPPQTLSDQLHTTVFSSRIEAKGQLMPLAILIDDSLFTIIRVQVASGINVKNVERIKNHLNALNAEFKMFKYYLREDGNIYLDICIPFADETFDPVMINTILPILVQQLENVYEDLMAVVWAKE